MLTITSELSQNGVQLGLDADRYAQTKANELDAIVIMLLACTASWPYC